MKYISQLNGFWNWVRTNEISHLEADLYLSILDIANASSWKPRFTIPNSTLGRFDKNSLIRARNKLVQYGLIKYDKGKKGQAPTYSVKKLYSDGNMNPNNDNYIDANDIISPNNDTYIDANNDANSDANMIPIQGTYIEKEKEEIREENIPPTSPYKKIYAMYHEICTDYPKLMKISDSRKRALSARLKKYTVADFETLFKKAQASSFLKGNNSSGWRATFDWLINESNMTKVLEGNYDDKPTKTAAATDEFADLEMLTRRRIAMRGESDDDEE